MTYCDAILGMLVVLTIVILGMLAMVSVVIVKLSKLGRRPRRDGYLVYPYLDLDEPGERGSYYSLVNCS